MKKRALISVSDKTGIVDFAKELSALGYEIISTGGTSKALAAAGVPVMQIDELTGFPECLDGRVKTLHPAVHAGILAMRSNPEHMKTLQSLGINTIDIVAVNLYPFKQTILKDGTTLAQAIENIDIGGPTMIRAAAKNYKDVAVIVNPEDYEVVLNELKQNGEVSQQTKLRLCYSVFEHTAAYDALITQYLAAQAGITGFRKVFTPTFELVQDMRYGENPAQAAAFYREIGKRPGSIVEAEQLHGKELSFNNINDTNGALELLKEFEEPTVVAVKHTNPCGVASGSTIHEAYVKAYESDPVSVFGGIIAANREIDAETATEISKIFIEIVVAPSFTDEALAILEKKANIRLLKLEDISKPCSSSYTAKKVDGGLLVQQPDSILYNADELKCVTKRTPTEKEMQDMLFAWRIVKHVKSNGIAIAKDKQSRGMGVGQVNRIWPTKQAIEHCINGAEGAAMASDAYFPFPDCVEAAAEAGITCIIHPGGSKNDQLSIDAADKAGIAMVVTGYRHFKH